MNLTFKKKYFCFVFSIILINLSYPPFDIGFLGWFSLVPFLIWIGKSKRKERDGFIFGFMLGATICNFIIIL